MQSKSVIHVCQSNKSCLNRGSEAVLVEIEELASLLDNTNEHSCVVKKAGCLAHCSEGPAVHVATSTILEDGSIQRNKPKIHTQINTLEKSAEIIKHATGQTVDLQMMPDETKHRLTKLKKRLARKYAISLYQWNKALNGLKEEFKQDLSLREELSLVLDKAGYSEFLDEKDEWMFRNSMPNTIEGYVPWSLQSVKIVSSHSVIFKLATKNPARSTPHPRGKNKFVSPVTWHTTMLGEVGKNEEGPLPWIERDYTPISSALEWERGRVEILIKVYNMGQLTSWLHKHRMIEEASSEDNICIWLSKPLKTLSVPNLVATDDSGFNPKSILLILAGTGVVALPQILAHRDPSKLLGVPTPKRKQLQCPIDLVLSCRKDDLLMLEEINNWCVDGKSDHASHRGLRNCTLLVTGKSSTGDIPFPDFQVEEHHELDKMKDNMDIRYQRLNKKMISGSLEKMIKPCRIVVSGPDSFNQAASEYLEECGVTLSSHVTILSS